MELEKEKNQVNKHLRVYITNVYVKYCLYMIGRVNINAKKMQKY